MSTAIRRPAPEKPGKVLTPRERTVRSDRRLGAITLLLRLPQVMAPLGLLTLVAVSSSSAWTAALSSASLCLGIAVSGVGVAALANARWRLWALAAFSLIQGIILWVLSRAQVTEIPVSWDAVPALAPFFVAGVVMTPMGLAARLRWASVLRAQDRSQAFPAAMRRESVNEGLATVLGAALTGLLAVTMGPAVVLRFAAVWTVLITAAFVLHSSARCPRADMPLWSWRRPRGAPGRSRAVFRLSHGLIYGVAALNALMGAVLGCLVVYSVSLDSVETMGVIYALLGFGAAVGSSLAVRFRRRLSAENMWILAATGALLASMLMSGPSGFVGYSLVLLALGLFSGPCLLCLHSSAGYVTAGSDFLGLVARMTVTSSIATALGLTLSAYLGVHFDDMTAAMVPMAAAMVLLATALIFNYTQRRSPGPRPRI